MQSKTKTTRGTSEKDSKTGRPAVPISAQPEAKSIAVPTGSEPGQQLTCSSNPLARPKHVTGPGIAPPQWRCIVREVLITETQLRRRVAELARAITRDYVGKDLVVVAVLTGTVMFLADLLRHLQLPLRLDFVGVSSYREGTKPGRLIHTKTLRVDIKDRDVLLVDDILDTGNTLAVVQDQLRRLRPRSLRTCVLLDKPARRARAVKVDYVGFVIPNVFVVGYGLDYNEQHRNLPFIGVLRT
ncbi:MAG: hypoxanthine phosphoribosyltransferase [Verrucomicrobia bacterium]|nr:hypoxanthine phosphoribosyltransferase [Verrucomicrobiota bacterium]